MRSPILLSLLTIALLSGYCHGIVEVANVPLNPGEDDIGCAILDESNGYAYYGTDTIPGKVIKVSLGSGLSAPTRIGTLTLNSGENNLTSAIIDQTNGYGYFGTNTYTGIIIKVQLGSGSAVPTRIAATSMLYGEGNFQSAFFVPGIGLFGGKNYFLIVSLPTGTAAPARVAAETLPYQDATSIIVSGQGGGYLYWGTWTSPGSIISFSVTTAINAPLLVSTLQLAAGEDYLASAAIDPNNNAGYFGTYTDPGKVVKVALTYGWMTRIGALTLTSGKAYLATAFFDSTLGYAFFGTESSPAYVIRVNPGPNTTLPTLSDAYQLTSGSYLSAVVNDDATEYAYFGTFTVPASVIKVAINQTSLAPTTAPTAAPTTAPTASPTPSAQICLKNCRAQHRTVRNNAINTQCTTANYPNDTDRRLCRWKIRAVYQRALAKCFADTCYY